MRLLTLLVIATLSSCKKPSPPEEQHAEAIRDRGRMLSFHRLPEGVCVVMALGSREVAITAVPCPATPAPSAEVAP